MGSARFISSTVIKTLDPPSDHSLQARGLFYPGLLGFRVLGFRGFQGCRIYGLRQRAESGLESMREPGV